MIGLQVKPEPELLMLVSVGEHFSLAWFLLENTTPDRL